MQELNNSLIDLYDGALHCGLAEFNQYALRSLRKAVAFNSCALADLTIGPEGRISVQSLYLDGTPPERLGDRSRTIGRETLAQDGVLDSRDTVLAGAFGKRGHCVVVDIVATASNANVLSYCRKYETAHSLAYVSAKSFGSRLPTLGLWRARKKDEYRPEQAYCAGLIIPHLIQARELNRRFNARARALPAAGTMMLATLGGQLHFIEEEVILLMQREWKEWTPPLLPQPLLDALWRTAPGRYTGRHIAVTGEARNGMLYLTIASRSGATARLTGAEMRVATLAAQGMQYKEIAIQLEVAPTTVRNQLQSVYRKLGVSNKTALAAALSRITPACS